MTNTELIFKIVEDNKKDRIAEKSNYAEPGCNGSYFMQETPVRTTSHWLISFACAYEIKHDEEYLKLVQMYADYLVDVVNKSANGVVCCIDDVKGFNRPNGLIGQAWLIEALVKAGEVLKNDKYYLIAKRVFDAQKYDWKLHLWKIVDIDNCSLGTDVAFNHNLWFAMSGLLIEERMKDNSIRAKIDDFMNWISNHLLVYKSGLISHFIVKSDNVFRDIRFRLKKEICQINKKGIPIIRPYQCEYERAYHLFSVYAFVRIMLIEPNYRFFLTKKWKRIKNYALDASNFKSFQNYNCYAYEYNSPAFEYPLIEYVLAEKSESDMVEELLQIQMDATFDGKKFSKNVSDVETLNARIYEFMQYLEMKEKKRNV